MIAGHCEDLEGGDRGFGISVLKPDLPRLDSGDPRIEQGADLSSLDPILDVRPNPVF
jgi:hypothetical protein